LTDFRADGGVSIFGKDLQRNHSAADPCAGAGRYKVFLFASLPWARLATMSCWMRPLKKVDGNPGVRAKPIVGRGTSPLQRLADHSAAVTRLQALQREADRPAHQVVQAYGLTDAKLEPVWRVSDTDKSAIPQDTAEGGNRLYATPDIIKNGDEKLRAASSAIGLNQSDDTLKMGGETIYSVAPYLRNQAVADVDHDRTKKLKQINSGDKADDAGEVADKILALWTDCGKAARTIMGVQDTGKNPKAATSVGDSKASGNPIDYSKEMYPKAIKAFFGSRASAGFLKEGVHYSKWFGRIWFTKPKDAAHAKRLYFALGEDGREAFDAHVGINRYVNPDIGDAYTMVTEKDMPGYKSSGRTWNFHWAGVIAKDGPDNLTLEGYAVSAAPAIRQAKETLSGKALETEIARLQKWAAEYVDRDWKFQMYGTKKGSTFHDDHLESGTHGNRATTFHAKG
jgi:hypothetical protein